MFGTFSTALFFLIEDIPGAEGEISRNIKNRIAVVKKVKGEVKVRNAWNQTWKEASDGQVLHRGDTVYTGEGANVTVEYLNDDFKVYLPESSFLSINRNVFLSAGARRTFYTESVNNSGNSGGIDKSQARVIRSRAYRMGNQPLSTKQAGNDNKISIEFKPEIIAVESPSSLSTHVIATSFPVYRKVVLDPSIARGKALRGYLWRDASGPTPVWVGQSFNGVFNNITIRRDGEYYFQAYSDDDKFVSEQLHFSVSALGEGE